MKKLLAILLAVALMATLLVGCGSTTATTTEEGTNADRTLTIATPADAKSMDPHLTNDLPSNNVFINMRISR